MSNIVAIVGRPNVGKSTLYNRMIGERQAIVDDYSGVTRDRMYGSCEWNGKKFTVVDTGGFVRNSDDIFEAAIRNQVEIAIEEASAIILMMDVTTGITDLDDQMSKMLRRTNKPVVLAVNKVDNHARLLEANEFWSLGVEETHFLSSISGSGSGELLDAVTDLLSDDIEEDSEIPKFAVVGQPNVGKSSFVNALLGEDRNVVTDIAGT
ncbi:MAG: GTPase, partial [Saprospiraceae bacterium]